MRVLFATHAIASHFQPLVPLARAVRAAGHATAFATGPEFVAVAEGLGFEGLSVGPDFDDDPELEALLAELRTLKGPESMAFALPNMFVRWAGMQALPQMEVAERRPTTRSFEESSLLHLVVQQQQKKEGRRLQEQTIIRQ